MRVAMIGATGLVGTHLSDRLLREGRDEVHALVRRPSGRSHHAWREHVAPPSEWPALAREIAPEAAVSTLGTTMRAAGSQVAFRMVDYDMVVAFAAAVREAGAQAMVTVSSVGAKADSSNFYLRLKGEMEEALRSLAFERLLVFRPGLLRGERGADRRLGERIGIALSPLVNLALRGPLDRYAAIDAERVAAAIAAALCDEQSGAQILHNRDILRLARR